MAAYDIIIIGAGISGLSLAHHAAKQGMKTLVIEKTGRAGGSLHSRRSDEGGFWIELGAHTCYNSYGNLINILEDCGITGHLIRREKLPFRMLLDNKIKSIPSQLNFPELFLSAPRLFFLKKEQQSVESYYSKIVGRKNFKRVFEPAFNAVISQSANDFPADMLFKKRTRRRDILKSFTFPTGIQTIADAIISRHGLEVMTGLEIRSISHENNLFSVSADNGRGFESQILAVATPCSVSAGLLQATYPDISRLLMQIRSVTIESAGVTVKKEAVSFKPLAGIIPANDSFFSVVSRDIVPNENYRGFTFHFRPGLISRDAKFKRICEVLGVNRGQLENVEEKDNIVPALRVGHERLIADLDRLLAGKRLLLTGNYFGGLAIEDCVSRSLSEFSRLKKNS